MNLNKNNAVLHLTTNNLHYLVVVHESKTTLATNAVKSTEFKH